MQGNVEFANTVRTWVLHATTSVEKIAQDSTYEVARKIIDRMPIDKSLRRDDIVSKGDWNAAIDGIPSDPNQGDESGEIAKSYIQEIVRRWKPLKGEELNLANHRHYMKRIEYLGWKNTPPYAPMGITILEWDNIVDKMVRKHNATT